MGKRPAADDRDYWRRGAGTGSVSRAGLRRGWDKTSSSRPRPCATTTVAGHAAVGVRLRHEHTPGDADEGDRGAGRLRPDALHVRAVLATASDGITIPISLVYRKGVRRDGSAPLLLYGYGSYGVFGFHRLLVEPAAAARPRRRLRHRPHSRRRRDGRAVARRRADDEQDATRSPTSSPAAEYLIAEQVHVAATGWSSRAAAPVGC